MKKTIHIILQIILPLLPICGCSRNDVESYIEGYCNVGITLGPECFTATKVTDPDEDKIHDLNIFIFDKDGNMEEDIFLDSGDFSILDDGAHYRFRWLEGTECQIYACANLGYRIRGIESPEDIMEYRYHLSYPDEYSRGIPMSGTSGYLKISGTDQNVRIKLERMMAKISLSIDRSALDKGTIFNVRSVRIGGCPKSVDAFRSSKAEGSTDVFQTGFMKSYGDADWLNIDKAPGISREISLYMLENMQGRLLPDASEEKDKVLDISDAIASVCSYVEIKAEYRSDSLFTGPESYLIYRFYLGDGPADFSVERNFHYHITIKPQGTGLSDTGWRIDKTALTRYGAAKISLHPGKYIEGNVGDDIHIWADVAPEGSRLVIGMEELEYDKSRGLYDYTMDHDGHGVTLHLRQPGSGIVYLEAGAPVSDSEMVFITINKKP